MPLGKLTIAAYGAPGLILAALGLTYYVFLPKYYADIVGINLSVLGAVVLLSRVWDALIDPAIGALSDRTRHRLGRRRPWMALGALPLAVFFFLLIALPRIQNDAAEGLYLGALTFLFFLFWTMVTVPYEALGAELSFNYDERSRLLGTREGAILAGTLLAALIPLLLGVGTEGAGNIEAERRRYLAIGVIYAGLVIVFVGVCLLVVRERVWVESQRPRAFLRNLAGIWRNRPFRILLSAYAVSALGAAVAATLILFYVEHVLGSNAGPLLLVIYLGIGTALVPLWIYLAKRLEKKRAWLLSLAINSGTFIWGIFLGRGDAGLFAVIVVLAAIGLGGVMILPPSMLADTIDHDEWIGGTRREGEYIGFWSITKKLAAALSAGLAFPILDWAGYIPGAAQQPSSAVWTLRLLYFGTPTLCYLIALVIGWRYPIDRRTHETLRRDIDARLASAAEPSAAPAG